MSSSNQNQLMSNNTDKIEITEVKALIDDAADSAKQMHHTHCTLEHVLITMLTVPSTMTTALEIANVNVSDMISDIANILSTYKPSNKKKQPKATDSLERVINRSVTRAIFAGRSNVMLVDVFAGMLFETNSPVLNLLKKYQIASERFVDMWEECEYEYANEQHDADPTEHKKQKQITVDYTTNLTELARTGKLTPVVGREVELTSIYNILAKQYKSNAMVVGDAGIGKNALIEGLALNIVNKTAPAYLHDHELFSVNLTDMVAGCKYRGDFEERVKRLFDTINKMKKAILFIDEAHTMTSGNSSDFSTIIKPVITRNKFKLIASTTWDEYYQTIEKDRALMRRFNLVPLSEPTRDETVKILRTIANNLEEYHDVTITDNLIEKCVDSSIRYIHNRNNPDKSIDLLDATCADNQVRGSEYTVITDDMLYEQLSRITDIPVDRLSNNTSERIKTLQENIKAEIYGQDTTIDAVLDRIYVAFAGINSPKKPLASFLFMGPSGTGKTETCRVLSKYLDIPLIKYDMSEFSERHSISTLIGSPPGYVGYNDTALGGGKLISDISKNPYSIIVFDEVEKAHPDIFNVFLQLLDEGKLTGANGKEVNARNTIIVMTSNMGSANSERNQIGFGNQQRTGEEERALKEFFKPEFRNRIDLICNFNKLSSEVIDQVVEKHIDKLVTSAKQSHNITLHVDKSVVKLIADVGYDQALGARPLARKIDELVCVPLAKNILFNDWVHTTVTVTATDGKIEMM